MKNKQENNDQPNGGQATGPTFSENEILDRAANIDHAVDANQSKNPLEQAMAGDLPPGTAEIPSADPAIAQSLQVVLTFSVAYLKENRGWTDPGEDWKSAVSQLGAKLLDKYLPGFLQGQTDELAIALLVLPWVMSNLMAKKPDSTLNDVELNDKPPNVVDIADRPFRERQSNENPIFEVQGQTIGT